MGVAGGGGPVAYHVLTHHLQFADELLHVQNSRQGVSGPVWGLVVVVLVNQSFTMCLHITCRLLTSCYTQRIDSRM